MADILFDRPRRVAMGLHSFLGPAFRHGGWLAVFLVLAPIIGPRGYGLFILALGGIAIVEGLLAESTVQALLRLERADERHWSTALVTLIAGGGAIWLALRAGAPLLDLLVGEPGFADLFRSLAVLPLLGGLGVVPIAILRRGGREGAIAAANVGGFAAGAGIALWLAWAGAGAWSLVAQIIAQRLVACVILWTAPEERIGLIWSPRHFTEIAEGLDAQALAAVWPVVTRCAPCLVAGLALGPVAAGLYVLSARLAEAVADIALAGEEEATPHAMMRRACRVLLPAVLASGLLAIALPPLIDLQWWGAVPPAQVLLLGTIPSAIIFVCRRSAAGGATVAIWSTVEALGGVAVAALLAHDGLVAMAAGSLAWLSAIAAVELWRMRCHFASQGRDLLHSLFRPVVGAALAGLFLWFTAAPVGLELAAIPALSLLVASAWLCYLFVRDAPGGETARTDPEIRRLSGSRTVGEMPGRTGRLLAQSRIESGRF
ncbi:MAG: oligosaccharide flippase family protein [Stellaceae bacterium]